LTGLWLSVTATQSVFCLPAASACSSAIHRLRSRGAAEVVDVLDDQAPLALKQFAERQRQGSSCLPLLSTIRGFCKAAL
jgi:hypothetical protein